MITKIFEVRDRATFIPVLAIKLVSDDKHVERLIRRAGFMEDGIDILVTKLAGEQISYSAVVWGGSRTMTVAHNFITANFDELKDGQVVDVEFLLGETSEPKVSEL